MNYQHVFNPARRPLMFKIYTEPETITLPLDREAESIPALVAIGEQPPAGDHEQLPDLATLARLLHYSAGITKTLQYPWGSMAFRAAACTGALYHIELYLVCRDLPDLAAGVYHYEPQDNALKQLRAGDYHQWLLDATADEPSVAHAPAVLIYTDLFWRNAVKYQAREYRHAFWDSGTILSHTLALAAAYQLPARLVTGFIDDTVNQLLDLEPDREASLALLPLGYQPHPSSAPAPVLSPLNLAVEPIAATVPPLPIITQMYQGSSLTTADEVVDWRHGSPDLDRPPPDGELIPLEPVAPADWPEDALERVIRRRGSSRHFARKAISFQELSTILERATGGIAADYLPQAGDVLYQPYLIVNDVDGLSPGSYRYHRQRMALERLKPGDFRRQARYLGLDQDLAGDASVNLYFLADLEPILAHYGNRGYRVAQLDASVAAGKVYLAAYAQRLGASGLTFYDDAVTQFFSPSSDGLSVMFLILIGHAG